MFMYVHVHSVMLVQSCVGKLYKLSEYKDAERAKEAVCPLLAPWSRLQRTDLERASGMMLTANVAASVILLEVNLLSILILPLPLRCFIVFLGMTSIRRSANHCIQQPAPESQVSLNTYVVQCTYPVYCRRPAAGLSQSCLGLNHMAPCP